MRSCVVLLILVAGATPAAAQSTYVGASLVGDIARFGGVDYDDDDMARILARQPSVDGEAIGFNVKIGRAITDRWGVEFEYARSGEFDDSYPFVLPAFITEPATTPPSRIDPLLFPYDFDVDSERHHTSMSALAFVRQDLGDRVELSFLGGIAFNRVETEHDFDIDVRRLAIYPPIFQDVETTEYHVGPAVGIEAAWKLGDAAAITGGVRLHGVEVSGLGGWLARPNVGLRWTF
jgi:opacity protein-like surface antigen